eukprot:scaffold85916_cov30-Tisochrysis_lutea.AAC.5
MRHSLLEGQVVGVGVRQPDHYDAPPEPVRKVDAFGHLAADHREEQCSTAPSRGSGMAHVLLNGLSGLRSLWRVV